VYRSQQSMAIRDNAPLIEAPRFGTQCDKRIVQCLYDDSVGGLRRFGIRVLKPVIVVLDTSSWIKAV